MKRVLGMAIAVVAATVVAASQTDWSSCGRSLTSLSDASTTAKRQVGDVESKQTENDDQQRRYTRCRQYPDTYDTYSDGCATLARRARSAQSDLDSAIDDLQRRIRYVEDAFNSVKSSCTGTSSGTDAATVCAVLRSMKNQYTEAQLLSLCRARMSEALCKACLSLK